MRLSGLISNFKKVLLAVCNLWTLHLSLLHFYISRNWIWTRALEEHATEDKVSEILPRLNPKSLPNNFGPPIQDIPISP